jgi:hypothetical protein
MEPKGSLSLSQVPATCPYGCSGRTKVSVQVGDFVFYNKILFNGDELLTPRLTPKLEDHTLSATLHTGGYSSIRNLRTRHAVVTGTNLSHGFAPLLGLYWF